MDIFDIARAIARAEGFYSPGSLPARANNPGDLELPGVKPAIEGKTVFPSVVSGWNHLLAQIAGMLSGTDKLWPATMTLADAGMRYSGGDPDWAGNVAKDLGVYPGTTLGELKIRAGI